MNVEGGCHCGAVRFRVEVSEEAELLDCNCSICSMTGYLHLIVPEEQFHLLQGEAELTEYGFGTGAARHLFCRICGVKSFYKPRSHPEGWSVNYRCLDEGHPIVPQIRQYDGKNWDEAQRSLGD